MGSIEAAAKPTQSQDTLAFLRHLLGDYHPRDFAVRLWDGLTWPAEPGQSTRATLIVRHADGLRHAILHPSDLALGEAYVFDDFDVEGDFEALFPIADFLLSSYRSVVSRLGIAQRLYRLAKRRGNSASVVPRLTGKEHSLRRDRAAVSYHYDRSNDFYALWLDRRMVYSCAYFADEHMDLDTAQERKLEYCCRKLRLRPGERLLDIGCGWGALILHAAQHYGVEAVGITLSATQAEFANKRIREAGLEGRCRVERRDYRELESGVPFDKIVSVGMVEHVGRPKLGDYFDQAWRLLKAGGVFLNHGIATPEASSALLPKNRSFVGTYVFPDGELIPIHDMLHAAETTGFETRDVESLRDHYVLTLRHWVRRLEEHQAEILAITTPETYRIWRLYMAGSAHSFQKGRINVYQSLLLKPDNGRSFMPLSRADWYQ